MSCWAHDTHSQWHFIHALMTHTAKLKCLYAGELHKRSFISQTAGLIMTCAWALALLILGNSRAFLHFVLRERVGSEQFIREDKLSLFELLIRSLKKSLLKRTSTRHAQSQKWELSNSSHYVSSLHSFISRKNGKKEKKKNICLLRCSVSVGCT